MEYHWKRNLYVLLRMYGDPDDDAGYDRACELFDRMAELADLAVQWAERGGAVDPETLAQMKCPIAELQQHIERINAERAEIDRLLAKHKAERERTAEPVMLPAP